MTIEVLREFDLMETEVPGSNTQEQEVKVWTRENILFLIDIVKKFDKEFASAIKKKCLGKSRQAVQTFTHKN